MDVVNFETKRTIMQILKLNSKNNIEFKSKLILEKNIVESMKDYKSGAVYLLNRKLRGLSQEGLTLKDIEILNNMKLIPRKIINSDAFVYRGVCANEALENVPLKIGESFLDK